jgi:RNA ligase (TIGR02306 family)
MSEFAVTIEKIEKIWPIEGADAIELAKVERFSYQFVVGKGQCLVGQLVIFFPIDSVIPLPVLEAVGMVGKFSGKNCDRVKTRKFKGQFSQGFVVRLPLLETPLGSILCKHPDYFNSVAFHCGPIGKDITEVLGVVKYEPPVVEDKAGKLFPLPPGVSKYDIEGCDRNPQIVELLLDKPVRILEKLEGQNASVQYCSNGTVYVNQRNFTIQEIPDATHAFWKLGREAGLIDVAKEISEHSGQDVLIYFEYLGPSVQGNIYKLNKPEGRVFDIRVGTEYLNGHDFMAMVKRYNLNVAPVLAFNTTLREWLGGQTVQEASNGDSVLFKTRREGIVITPMIEERHYDIGRLIIKQRSPAYLEKSEF